MVLALPALPFVWYPQVSGTSMMDMTTNDAVLRTRQATDDHAPATPRTPRAASRTPHAGPARYKMATVTWLAAYPAITIILAVLEPLGVLNAPMPVRTLLLTVILIPLMVYVLVPTISRLLGRWLRH